MRRKDGLSPWPKSRNLRLVDELPLQERLLLKFALPRVQLRELLRHLERGAFQLRMRRGQLLQPFVERLCSSLVGRPLAVVDFGEPGERGREFRLDDRPGFVLIAWRTRGVPGGSAPTVSRC